MASPLSLRGYVAVVTGASRGIGAAVARALAAAEATVVRIARTVPEGRSPDGIGYACDLTDAEAVTTVMARVCREVGVPSLVVNNAGAFTMAPLEATSPEVFDAQIAINLRAPYLVARALVPAMRTTGAIEGDRDALGRRHLLIGSVADHVGFPDNAAYAASKFGVRGLHEVLRAECHGSGVLCTLISPGPTDTAVWDPWDPDTREGFPPRASMLRPEDVADAVLFTATRPARVDIEWLRLVPA